MSLWQYFLFLPIFSPYVSSSIHLKAFSSPRWRLWTVQRSTGCHWCHTNTHTSRDLLDDSTVSNSNTAAQHANHTIAWQTDPVKGFTYSLTREKALRPNTLARAQARGHSGVSGDVITIVHRGRCMLAGSDIVEERGLRKFQQTGLKAY